MFLDLGGGLFVECRLFLNRLLKLLLRLISLVKLLLIATHRLFQYGFRLEQRIYLVLLSAHAGILTDNLFVKVFLAGFQFSDQLDLLPHFISQRLLLVEYLLHRIILGETQARPTLHDFVQVRDLLLKISDDFSRIFLFLFRLLDQLPRLVHLSLQHGDGARVLLCQLNGCLHPHGVVCDRLVHVLTTFKEPLFVLVGSTEGSVKALILGPKPIHRLLSDHLVKDSLEILLELVKGCSVHAELDEIAVLYLSFCHMLEYP